MSSTLPPLPPSPVPAPADDRPRAAGLVVRIGRRLAAALGGGARAGEDRAAPALPAGFAAAAGDACVALRADLDGLDALADALGEALAQQVGDAAAQRLSAGLPAGAALQRLDDGRFVLWLPGLRRDAALALAHRLAQGFGPALVAGGVEVQASLRIGLAQGEPGDDAAAVLARAEAALRAARRRGLDVLPHDRLGRVDGAAAAALLSALQRALDHGELGLMLQPRIALADGGVVGADATLRWRHPTRGELAAAEFLPAALHTGLVRRLGDHTLGEAARHWEQLRAGGAALRLAVGLSLPELLDAELPTRLERTVQRHGAPPQAFCLRVPARACSGDEGQAEQALRRLAERGFRLGVELPGDAAVSPAALARLPLHEVGLDATPIGGPGGRADAALRASIALARALGLGTLATGVGSAAAAAALRDWGCVDAQGPAWADPLPAADLPGWCARWRTRDAGGA
jgi:EAL domain-containing protein (putative c-di-GMP-specific phosphodiesterase class I)/GGDEF domain-containing protein